MARGQLVDRLTFGRARRRRRMLKRLRELDRLDARTGGVEALWAGSDAVPEPAASSRAPFAPEAPPYASARSDAERRERRRRRRVRLATALVVVSVAGLYLHDTYGLGGARVGAADVGDLGPLPEPGQGGTYEFIRSSMGRPVTYSSCRPLRLVVNADLEPPGASGVVEEAVARVAQATGLDLTVTGPTSELPSSDRPSEQPGRYGAGWAPVLVAWTTPEIVSGLEGDVVGLGGSTAISAASGGPERYVTGAVSLDAPALAEMLTRPQGRALVRAVVMHELGHVVGLGHVDDPNELMAEENAGRTDFGPGDVSGLALLGSGPCT